MIDYESFVASESERFRRAVESITTDRWPDTTIVSCPEWSVPDLVWHLSEVQHFWATMLTNNLADPSGYERPTRPADDELLAFFDGSSDLLLTALRGADPDAPCWSWYEPGRNVGWVLRRQAHEALVHRVDAELAVGRVTEIDERLAADGIDEMLHVMLDVGPLPPWASYETDGTAIAIVAGSPDGPGEKPSSWTMTLGRFTGSDPKGTVHDLAALQLSEASLEVAATVEGPASEINLWLWGRSLLEQSTVTGDKAIVEQLRAVAADATQ